MKIKGLELVEEIVDVDYDFNNTIVSYWQTPDGKKFASREAAVAEIMKGHLHGCLLTF